MKSFGFVLVLVFLGFEYGRPQDYLSVVGAIRPALILTLLMAIAWLRSGKLHRAAKPQLIHMVLMFFLLALWVPLAHNNGLAYKTTFGFLLLLPLSISIVLFVDNFERLRVFMKWWTFLALAIAVNGIIGRGVAGSSFLADENDFSLLMNIMLPFAFFLYVYERRGVMKWVYLAAFLLCVVSIVKSGSRGGFVGLVAVAVVIWLASPKKILSLALVSILALTVYFAADQKYWSDMATIQNTDQGTAQQRFDSWQAGWNMFLENPLGVGPGNFPIWFPEYQPPGAWKRSMWGREAHSLWFTLLPELGVPGVLLYFSLLRLNLRDILYLKRLSTSTEDYRFARYLSLAFIASLAGFFVSGTFLSVLYYPHYWYLTAMIVATRAIVDNSSPLGATGPARARRNTENSAIGKTRGRDNGESETPGNSFTT